VCARLPVSIQNKPRRLRRIKALHWQTPARGSSKRNRKKNPAVQSGVRS
jgi:hypothetical protein